MSEPKIFGLPIEVWVNIARYCPVAVFSTLQLICHKLAQISTTLIRNNYTCENMSGKYSSKGPPDEKLRYRTHMNFSDFMQRGSMILGSRYVIDDEEAYLPLYYSAYDVSDQLRLYYVVHKHDPYHNIGIMMIIYDYLPTIDGGLANMVDTITYALYVTKPRERSGTRLCCHGHIHRIRNNELYVPYIFNITTGHNITNRQEVVNAAWKYITSADLNFDSFLPNLRKKIQTTNRYYLWDGII